MRRSALGFIKKTAKKAVASALAVMMMIPLFTVEAAGEMKISSKGINLIKQEEGFFQYKYWDYSQWTIGYGTGVSEDEYPDGITEKEAEALLYSAVERYEKYVNNFASNYGIKLRQNQFDALVSLTYNMGNIWSAYDSFDLKDILIDGADNHSFLEIAKGFGEWRVAGGGVLQGLVNRRQNETELFLSDRTDHGSEVWRVNSSTGTNLRKDASASSQNTGFMPYNTIYSITEKKTTGDGYLWGKTFYEGKEHWCVLDYSRYMVGGPLEFDEEGAGITGEKWIIESDDGVRLRRGPGLNYSSLGVVPYKTEIYVSATAEADGYLWGKIRYAGKEGWCALDYAKKADGGQSELPGKLLESIYIAKAPVKTVYSEGEGLSLDGIDVRAVYSDGTIESVTDIAAEGFESVTGEHVVTVSYMEKTAQFTVTVKEKKLCGIEISKAPEKTVYLEGEPLDLSGMTVNAVFDNGTKEEISHYSVSGYDPSAGMKIVEIGYEGYTTYLTVNVSKKKVVDIEITKMPDKLTYREGEAFSTDGMEICAVYDNGSREPVYTWAAEGYDPSYVGEQRILIKCSGIYKTINVTVVKPDPNELPGDLNGDMARDLFDLVLMNRYIENGFADPELVCPELADIDGDGKIDRKDAEMLSVIVSYQ